MNYPEAGSQPMTETIANRTNEDLLKDCARAIPREEQLIPNGFKALNILEEIKNYAASDVPLGYPPKEGRHKLSEAEIDAWAASGYTSRPDWFPSVDHHPNILNADGSLKKGVRADNGTQSFFKTSFKRSSAGTLRRNERGIPLHPHAEMLAEVGTTSGLGFYYDYGPNWAADPVVFRVKNGKLQVLVIQRVGSVSDKVNLPGGMLDSGETGISATVRELFEESGAHVTLSDGTEVELKEYLKGKSQDEINVAMQKVFEQMNGVEVGEDIVIGDGRGGLNSWPESMYNMMFPPKHIADRMRFKPQEKEVTRVEWLDLTKDNLVRLGFSHRAFTLRCLDVWQSKYNKVVGVDGRIGIAG